MADAANTGIYEIVNLVNGKRYVGSAVNLRHRWRQHRCELGKGRHNPILQNAWRKYGEAAFEFRVIEIVRDPRDLIAREQHYIDAIKPEYNVARIAGSRLGVPLSPEHKAQVSATHKRLWSSPEHRAKVLEARRGYKTTPEHKENLSKALKGRELTAEHKAIIAANNRKRNKSPEQRAAASAFHKGRKKPADQIAKMAATKRGQTLSLEHREKVSLGLKEAYAAGTRRREKSQEQREKISTTLKGRRLSGDHLLHVREANSRLWPEARRLKHSASLRAAWAKRKRAKENSNEPCLFPPVDQGGGRE